MLCGPQETTAVICGCGGGNSGSVEFVAVRRTLCCEQLRSLVLVNHCSNWSTLCPPRGSARAVLNGLLQEQSGDTSVSLLMINPNIRLRPGRCQIWQDQGICVETTTIRANRSDHRAEACFVFQTLVCIRSLLPAKALMEK
uniref:Uncharacterized protein n=1 Tax=Knipowitschia caucasica TaxID=637954 RepID=A0AAV2ME04_KNICA